MENKTKVQGTKVQETKIPEKKNKKEEGTTIAKVAGQYEIRNTSKGIVIFVKKDLKVLVRLMKASKKA